MGKPWITIHIKGQDEPITYKDGEAVEFVKEKLDKKYAQLRGFAKKAWGGLSPYDKAAVATSTIPVVGDIAGLMADANMYITDPESRTLLNAGLSAVGLIPFVPALSTAKKVAKGADANKITDIPSPLFGEDNRLSNINKKGGMWDAIKRENPNISEDGKIKVYRATIGDEINPNDYVAANKQVALDHMENLKDRGEVGKLVEMDVDPSELMMANDATEFVYTPLPMDEASRMQRAKDMGFDVDETLYHGTARDIDEFKGGINWASKDPKLADDYSYIRETLDKQQRVKSGDANILPLVGKYKNSFNADKLPNAASHSNLLAEMVRQSDLDIPNMPKPERDLLLDKVDDLQDFLNRTGIDNSTIKKHELWYEKVVGAEGVNKIKDIFNEFGFDSIKMTEDGAETVGLFKPEQYRSVHAKFDPSKASSANILAGAGAAAVGTSAYMTKNEEEKTD